MGHQLPLPASWAAQPQMSFEGIHAGQDEVRGQLAEMTSARHKALRDLRCVLDELAGKAGVSAYDVAIAMESVKDAVDELLYHQKSELDLMIAEVDD